MAIKYTNVTVTKFCKHIGLFRWIYIHVYIMNDKINQNSISSQFALTGIDIQCLHIKYKKYTF